MTESPAALLERAAAMLEQMAKDAAMGPWRADHLLASTAIKTGEGSPYPGDHLANVGSRFTANWIATMSPAVAAPLVELLRDAARRADKHAPLSPDGSTFQRSALALARVMLGENTEEDAHA